MDPPLPTNGACSLWVHWGELHCLASSVHTSVGDRVQQCESINPSKYFKVLVSLLSSLAVFLAPRSTILPYFITGEWWGNNKGHVQAPARERKVHRAGGQNNLQKHYQSVYSRTSWKKYVCKWCGAWGGNGVFPAIYLPYPSDFFFPVDFSSELLCEFWVPLFQVHCLKTLPK